MNQGELLLFLKKGRSQHTQKIAPNITCTVTVAATNSTCGVFNGRNFWAIEEARVKLN